ncbi:hypothetical protein SISSUDRAFT_1037675 [Sistotremastrum suecicum HHB10207 ss-3]|uniref:Uncharacterized protein n=1 Tax=Sistotremastrum suecicum HHB10207 ss-3 TaxID=1314776 RepID=A0A165XTK7_9AGAM|nr:hypothetical protein SISSUDRAFT_1037675 [Sistotremastrum suecicum HHB10207 ss-3]
MVGSRKRAADSPPPTDAPPPQNKKGRRDRRAERRAERLYPASSPDPTPAPPLPINHSVNGFQPDTAENNEDVDMQAMSLAQDCAIQMDRADVSQVDSVIFPDHSRGCVVHSKNTHYIPPIPSLPGAGVPSSKTSIREFLQPRYIVPGQPWAPFVPVLLLFDQPAFQTLRPLQNWPTEGSFNGTRLRGNLLTSWKQIEDLFQKMSDVFSTHLRSNPGHFPLFGDRDIVPPIKPSVFGYQNAHSEGHQAQTQATLANVAFHVWIGYLTFFFHLFGPNDQPCVDPLWHSLLSTSLVEPAVLAQLRETVVFRPRHPRAGLFLSSRDILDSPALVNFYLSYHLPIYYYWDNELIARVKSPDPTSLLLALEPPESRFPREDALRRNTQSAFFDRFRHVRYSMYRVQALGEKETREINEKQKRYEQDGGCTCFPESKVFEWLSLTPDGPYVLCREIHAHQRESIFQLYHPRHRFYDPRSDRWDLCLGSTNPQTSSMALQRHSLPEHNFLTDLRSIIDTLPASPLGEFHPVSHWDTELGKGLAKAIRPWESPPPYSIFPTSLCSLPNTDAQFVSVLHKRYGLAPGSYPNDDPELESWNRIKVLIGFDRVTKRSPEVQDYRTPFGFVCVMEKPDPPDESPFDFGLPTSPLILQDYTATRRVNLLGNNGEKIQLYAIAFGESSRYLVLHRAVDVLSLYRRNCLSSIEACALSLFRYGVPFSVMIKDKICEGTKIAAAKPYYMFSDHVEPMMVYKRVTGSVSSHNAAMYKAYQEHCRVILSRPHARVALGYGGFIARVAHAIAHGRYWAVQDWGGDERFVLKDDLLTHGERRIISGMIYPSSGYHSIYSYWPPPHLWRKLNCAWDMGFWTPMLEDFYMRQHNEYLNGAPPREMKWWHNWMRTRVKPRGTFRTNTETPAAKFLNGRILQPPRATGSV